MSQAKDQFQSALEFILEGVATSTEIESRAQVGMYLMELVIVDNHGRLDREKIKAIQMLIQIADEAES
ncbi:hypothetical protein ACB087_01180 [Vibrio sp. VNB-15]